MKVKLIIYNLFLWSSLLCFGQTSKLFTADRELSSSLINKIYQDKNGMIWIATEDGLNRYDGAKFTVYKHKRNDEHSLMHNFVRTIFEDSKGRLFIGTYKGLQMYDPAKDCFSLPAQREDGNTFESNIIMLLEKKNGEIWVSGNEMGRLEINGDKITVKELILPIPILMIGNFLEDKNGNMWFTFGEKGLYRIDTNNRYQHYFKQQDGTPIIDVIQDLQGNIYAGSMGNGFFKYDKRSDSFTSIPYAGQSNLPIKSLYLANQSEIYIGTDGNGLKIYNNRTNEITDNRFDNSYFDLTNSKIHAILKDNAGNFWLAIYQKGVMMIPAQPNSFKYIGSKSINKNIIGSYCTTALCKSRDGTLWVGTDNDGIYGITEDCKQKHHFSHSDGKNSVPSIIITLYEDTKHNLWFGSFTGGMGKLDKATGKCTYLDDLRDSNGKRIQRVYCFAEDKDKRLWIATMGAGLFYYDLETGQLTHHKLEYSEWISCLLYSSDNKLYIGTYDGILCIDLNTPDFTSSPVLSKCIILSMYEDMNGTIWAGTSEGLSSWNPQKKQLETFTMEDGLPSNFIYAIQGDANNSLWVSTNSGISQFNLESRKFINYYVGDGLQGNEFSKNASLKDEKGNLWFGGVNGITYFNPQEITKPAKKWNIRITDFYLHNQPVRKGMQSGNYDIIDQPVFEAQNFHLSHKDNAFSIEFSTLEYNSPERLTYMYSMNNSDWIVLRNGINRISFNDLPPGTYHLRVQAKDDNVLSDIKKITILISPAWYASNLAKLCYVLLVTLILFFIILQIIHRYRIRQEMMEHIHAEEINEAKLQFFINISHEIRTPMSLIISPLQKLMAMDSDPERQRSYRTISRNAERILRLVNQLMDIRKIDKGQMSLKFQEIDVVEFIKDLCTTFEYQINTKQIALNFEAGTEELYAWVDPKNFDKIILNLFSNALKFTPEKGSIDIILHTGKDAEALPPLQHYFEVIVADTGIGIDESEMNRIFERFYQIRNSHNNSNIGTGIGLHLTRSLVELHHGTIRVERNENGIGSRFIIRLPLGNSHLSKEEIDESENTEAILPPIQPMLHSINVEEDNLKFKSKSKYRILVVEDDEEIRKYICRELSSEYHTMESANGKEALSLILKTAPNLVISDIMMPEMDGLTLCRKIKQNVNINHIPVILLTAKTREEDNLEGLEMGADAYITKPFNIDFLKKTLENIIKGREMLKNCFSGNQEQEVKIPLFSMQSIDNKLLDKIMNVIIKNISNPELSVEKIASEVGMSRVHLHRKLKELTNQSPRDLIRNVRLKQAATLLAQKSYNITEIADLTGFTSITIFSRSFKEFYGMSPSEYMQTNEKPKEETSE